MIYIGYPCIGKSNLANKKSNKFIDLESSYFHNKYYTTQIDINDSIFYQNNSADRVNNYLDKTSNPTNLDYETYCKIAIDLNNQGFYVFVSSHSVVIDYLYNYYKEKAAINMSLIYPDKSLYKNWCRRALERFLNDNSEKNRKALNRIIEHFNSDIDNIENTCNLKRIGFIKIKDVDYDLEEVIENYIKEINKD